MASLAFVKTAPTQWISPPPHPTPFQPQLRFQPQISSRPSLMEISHFDQISSKHISKNSNELLEKIITLLLKKCENVTKIKNYFVLEHIVQKYTACLQFFINHIKFAISKGSVQRNSRTDSYALLQAYPQRCNSNLCSMKILTSPILTLQNVTA